MNDTYLTIASPAEGLYKDKGSRFIARVYPVESEEAIKEILAAIKKQYYDARHHCYAWILGTDKPQFRMNDDGEPSGTAGRPIHGQLVSVGLTNVLLVVIRYFGGTKLGVRGLINAYKGAAQDALQASEIICRIKEHCYSITFDYLLMNDVMKLIKEHDLTVIEHQYDQSCTLKFSVRQNKAAQVVEEFNKIKTLDINIL